MSDLTRRLITWPALLAAATLWFALLPLWLVLAFAVDRVRRPSAALRTALYASVFLLAEIAGITAALILRPLGLLHASGDVARHRALQAAWLAVLWKAAVWLYGLQVIVEDHTGGIPGPFLLLVRHTSLADTALAARFVARPHGVGLRYVLKEELLWDPCLDLVGQRLPNAFVRRDGADGAAEARKVADLGRNLAPNEGVLIYPEGTRFTRTRRMLALQRLATREPERLARAEALRNLLPPRPGGVLALLDAIDGDVVVLGHTGMEGAGDVGSILAGGLLGRTIRVALWRHPRSAVPAADGARMDWIFGLWEGMDAWIDGAPR